MEKIDCMEAEESDNSDVQEGVLGKGDGDCLGLEGEDLIGEEGMECTGVEALDTLDEEGKRDSLREGKLVCLGVVGSVILDV